MLNESELNQLLKATEGTTKGARHVVVTPSSVALYATSENCRIYLAELDPVCLKRTHDRQVADAKFHAAFDPTTCAELVREVLRLMKEVADYEQTDLVPRSRWEATNNDWLEMRRQYHELAKRATAEIERLEAKGKQP